MNQLNYPDVIVLAEIKSVSPGFIRKFFKGLGYEILSTKSGICLAAKTKFKMVNVTVSMHPNIVSGALKLGSKLICITSAYGLQESESADDRTNFHVELAAEIESSLSRFPYTVLVGDLNAKISHGNSQVIAESPNGVLLKEVVSKYGLEVLNFNTKCVGKWTRVQYKKNPEVIEKSVIDYVMVCKSLLPYLSEMIIDEEKTIGPFWVRRNKKKGDTRKHSDHNSILFKASIPWSPNSEHPNTSGVQGGHRLTEEGLVTFKKLTEHMDIIPGIDFNTFKGRVTDIMDIAFPKKSPLKPGRKANIDNMITNKHLIPIVRIVIPFLKRGKAEKAAAKKYISFLQDLQMKITQKLKSARVIKTLSEINNDNGQFSIEGFWKLKNSLSLPDRSRSSVISREGVELFGGPAILEEYMNEFSGRLSKSPPHPKFSRYVMLTNKLFEKYLESASSSRSEPDFEASEITKVVSTLKPKCAIPEMSLPSEVYKYGGTNLVSNLTTSLNLIKESLKVPESWANVVISAIYKNKGSRKVLEFYRGIFLTVVVSKVLEKLIKLRIEPHLSNVNKLQAGSTKNRGTCDSTFLLNGMIDHARYLNTELFLTFYDYTTCFDSLWLEECMIVLWDLGIRNELFSLIFLLNESSVIRVNSPFGMTRPFECPRIVKQGTVLGPTLCSSSTAELCDRNTIGGVLAGSTVISNLLYVDDTTDVNTNIADHVDSHNEVVNFAWSKGLGLNFPKCLQMIINQKSTTPTPTLPIGDGFVKQVKSTKVVGNVVNERGTNIDMINERVKNGIGAIASTLSICNEVTMGISFVEAALTMHEAVVIATLISDSQAWTNLAQKDIKRLQAVQLRHLKRIVRAPSSTCNAFLFLEMGVLPVVYFIHIRQLSFLHHIINLDDNDPVNAQYHAQLLLPYERNWANESTRLLKLYELDKNSIPDISKEVWKLSVKKAVMARAFTMLRSECASKSKTKSISYERMQCQQYLLDFNWKSASVLFKLRGGVADCMMNKKSSTDSDDLSCRLCGTVNESQSHAINCPKVTSDIPVDIGAVYGTISVKDTVINNIINRYECFVDLLHKRKEERPSTVEEKLLLDGL